jgi:Ca2+-transporting ATPase
MKEIKKQGLSEKKAKELLGVYGYNELTETDKKTALSILLRQVKNNFIVYLLFAAMVISFFVGKDITAYTILAVILAVVFSGFIQEYKAEEALESLKKMVVPMSLVLRDGKEKEIDSKEIVPGDILILRSGKKVPADCLVLEENELMANEAVMTGESKEVAKEVPIDFTKYKDENLLFAGSFVVNGKCIAKVIHTGMNTRFGKIAGMISSAEKQLPLQDKVNKIAKYMAIVGATMAFCTAGLILLNSEISKELMIEVLILAVAISVSAFPEGFPVVLITTLSVGAYKMAKKNAIVSRISIIETLGETTVICSDKTGTITKGEMTVKKIYCDNKDYDVSGIGFSSEGDIVFKGKNIDIQKENNLNLLTKISVLCSDATINKNEKEKDFRISGQPTEAALMIMSAKAGIFKEDFPGEKLKELSFNSERKMMSVMFLEEGEKNVYVKGAPEVIIAKCSSVRKKDKTVKLTAKEKDKIILKYKEMNAAAYRTIAFAYRESSNDTKSALEENFVFLGLAGMEDSPREEVRESLKICNKAGISVKMITGDNKETAISIAGQIGLKVKKVIEGEELDKMTDEELSAIVKEVGIFARVRPSHKIRIVKALKNKGEIVTMTGDGVNDSPALKEAHVGVAMGKTGTDVSRSVADLILKDDNFATIVDAVREGRAIFNNIRKFTTYQLSCNSAELIILFVGVLLSPILGWPIPVLLALHILFMNLITDNLPAITLGFNNSSPDIMSKKPRRNAKILVKSTIIPLIISGLFMAFLSLLAFWISYNILDYDVSKSRTITLLVLILLEIAGAFSFRSFRKCVIGRSVFINKYLVYASLASVLATIIIIYTPVNKIFEMTPLSLIDWIVATFVAFSMILVFDLLKTINKRKKYLKFD